MGGRLLLDTVGKFSWSFLVNFRGHFFDSNETNYTLIKQSHLTHTKAVARSENLGGHVILGGENVHPLRSVLN